MKLILSSCDFSNDESREVIYQNLPKPIEKCKMLYIPNDRACPEAIASDVYCIRMQEYGFTKENVIVFDHTRPDDFKNLDLDIIYVGGGNTFGIYDKIRKCNFDKNIIDYVKSGVTYIGGSAGAYIVTQNIEHVLKYDDNNVEMTDFNGLGLFDGVILCHYTYLRKFDFDELCKTSPYKAYCLTDSDSIVYTC